MSLKLFEIRDKVAKLKGPILILGAGGFIGANLLRSLCASRKDVFGTVLRTPSWRLNGIPENHLFCGNLLVGNTLENLLNKVRPITIFNCLAYGAYSFQEDIELIYQSNFNLTAMLLHLLSKREIVAYVHAGSSSEYGFNATAPCEASEMEPNSHYAVSKLATSGLISFFGKAKKLPYINLRLYSVYGPYEDASRLIPNAIIKGLQGELPRFVNPKISRDFVYVGDVCEAFVDAATQLQSDHYGQSFNVGTGEMTTIGRFASLIKEMFAIKQDPVFTMENRSWDIENWVANPEKIKTAFNWESKTPLSEGLLHTKIWYESLDDKKHYISRFRKPSIDTKYSISAVIACYKDEQAIPIMYERLSAVFKKLNIDYEIIFVNDCSPDDSERTILDLSQKDPHVIGITHSRNFGSQEAFRSGMELASKNACVLLDGDLQDPPELIEQFVVKWKEGFDIVYGRRVKRKAPWYMQIAYKAFYRIFDAFSYIKIPRDAGDFSLISRGVAKIMLQFPERDIFLRGVRAFVGFKQVGVDYVRPERMFGATTNNLLKNLDWAKKGILSFSNVPISFLSFFSLSTFVVVVALIVVQLILKLAYPEIAPKGITTVLLAVLFFGSSALVAIGIVGEYIGKIFTEIKQRPHFIRSGVIRKGKVHRVEE